MKGLLSLSMGPVQQKINDVFRPETSDIYGSLFEFLDGNDFVTAQARNVKDRLATMKHEVRQKIKQENEGAALLPGLRSRSSSKRKQANKLASILKNIHDDQGIKPTNTISSDDDVYENVNRNMNLSAYNRTRKPSSPHIPSKSALMNKTALSLRKQSTINQSQNESLILKHKNSLETVVPSPKKSVAFDNSPTRGSGKATLNTVQSKVAQYTNKKQSVLEGQDKQVALWNMYQIESQNKKKSYLNSEHNVLNNLAIKGSHHLLKAQREVMKKGDEHPGKRNESYTKSFMRIRDTLKVLREKKQTSLYFDEEGNYISSYAKAKSGSMNNVDQTQTNFHSAKSFGLEKNEQGSQRENENASQENTNRPPLPSQRPESPMKRPDETQTGFNPFKVVLPPREKEEEEKVERKKPKTLYDYRRQLVFKEQEKWIDYHRTVKKKKEIEQINNEKEIPSYIQYIRRIIEINPQTQKAQLRRIEEELIEKRAIAHQKLKKRPDSVDANRDE